MSEGNEGACGDEGHGGGTGGGGSGVPGDVRCRAQRGTTFGQPSGRHSLSVRARPAAARKANTFGQLGKCRFPSFSPSVEFCVPFFYFVMPARTPSTYSGPAAESGGPSETPSISQAIRSQLRSKLVDVRLKAGAKPPEAGGSAGFPPTTGFSRHTAPAVGKEGTGAERCGLEGQGRRTSLSPQNSARRSSQPSQSMSRRASLSPGSSRRGSREASPGRRGSNERWSVRTPPGLWRSGSKGSRTEDSAFDADL